MIGGYFAWLALPGGLSGEALAKRCLAEEQVVIAAGTIFEVPGDDEVKFEGSIRLCWAWEDVERLEEGVRRVGVVARRMLDEIEKGDSGFVVVERDGEGVDEFK